jgi:hypothetical protein
MRAFSVVNIMAERLLRLINNPGFRAAMGTEGRKCIEANYDHNKEMDGLEVLFNGLIGDKTLISGVRAEEKEMIRERIRRVGARLEKFSTPALPMKLLMDLKSWLWRRMN